MKVFISYPMTGFSIQEREEHINKCVQQVHLLVDKDLQESGDVVRFSYCPPHEDLEPFSGLSEAFELMANADYFYFHPDWRNSKGCTLEHKAAEQWAVLSDDNKLFFKRKF